MENILVELMSQLTTLTAEERLDIEDSFPIRTFSKGVYLLKEGQVARDVYLVVKGCIRSYQLLDGEERTTEFYTENQSVVDFQSLGKGKPSVWNWVCMEETTLGILNAEKEKALYEKHPRFETFCREGMEEMMGDLQGKLSSLINLNPEERYRKLVEERPGLLNRVPQYQLASYLGIQPETLSRIRKRILEKGA